jgi:hypothetical protein
MAPYLRPRVMTDIEVTPAELERRVDRPIRNRACEALGSKG